MKSSASTIPVKIKHVRECALASLSRRESKIHDRLREIAAEHIAEIEKENRSLLRRLGWRKKLKVENIDDLVSEWAVEKSNHRRVRMTEVWWAYSHTDTDWWKHIVTLSTLPTSKDEEVMNLSVSDAQLIGFNGFIHAVSKAINP